MEFFFVVFFMRLWVYPLSDYALRAHREKFTVKNKHTLSRFVDSSRLDTDAQTWALGGGTFNQWRVGKQGSSG